MDQFGYVADDDADDYDDYYDGDEHNNKCARAAGDLHNTTTMAQIRLALSKSLMAHLGGIRYRSLFIIKEVFAFSGKVAASASAAVQTIRNFQSDFIIIINIGGISIKSS